MRILLFVFIGIIGILGLTFTVSAQEETATDTVRPYGSPLRSPLPFTESRPKETAPLKQEVRERIDTKHDEVRLRVRDNRESAAAKVEERRGGALEKGTTTGQIMRDKVDNLREKARKQMNILEHRGATTATSTRDAARAQAMERKLALIKAHFIKTIARLHAAVERLQHILERIESRADKLEERGRDVSLVRTLIAIAKDKLEAAKQALDNAVAEFENADENQEPKEAFERARSILRNAIEAIKEAHKAIVDVLRALKAADTESSDDENE